MTTDAAEPKECRAFRWIGQSLLCCDQCGQPWFLHDGHARHEGIFDPKVSVKPFTDEERAEIPGLIATWEANAFWQRETHWHRTWAGESEASHVERQVGKDFPYPKGPVRPVAAPGSDAIPAASPSPAAVVPPFTRPQSEEQQEREQG